jgi:ubiquinone/menaquinone biosynthesis C-methylase UbiE
VADAEGLPGTLKGLAGRLVDATARRPGGWIGRRAYGGEQGAPPGHEGVFDRVLEWAGPLQGKRVLEIGCGGGRLLERVLESGAGYAAGLDHSPDMLALSMRRNRDALADEALHLKLGDAARIPWPDGSFDVVLTANVFFFIDQPNEVLAELRRVLVPGGRLVIATAPGPLPAPSLRNWWVAVWGRALTVHTDEEMRGMLDGAGFAGVEVESEDSLQIARATTP